MVTARRGAASKSATNGSDNGTGNGDTTVKLLRLRKGYVDIKIVGTAPYIPHRWSEKAKQMMPGHPMKDQIEAKKGPHQPEEEAHACLYLLPGDDLPLEQRLGAPATAFKAALIKAVGLYNGLTKVNTKIILHVVGQGPEQLVPISGELELHLDLPRNNNSSVDLRYRYYVLDWSGIVRVEYFTSLITADSIVSLLHTAGAAGIGDWRPSAPKSDTGTYGTWEVEELVQTGLIADRWDTSGA